MSQERTVETNGLILGLSATLLWGSYPLWYKPLTGIDSYQLLAWRVVFAELFLIGLVFLTGRAPIIKKTLSEARFVHVLTIASVLALWWLMYIYGIVSGRVLEVAFGYFLSPVISMLVSSLVFKERLSSGKKLAVGLALVGVALMALELLNLQSFPWIALVIGFCYSFYGVFKKKVSGDPLVVQSLEIGLMLPFAMVFLGLITLNGAGHQFALNAHVDLLLVATGLITVLPLWWYSLAAKQLGMFTLSFLQFVPPTCNFLLGAFYFEEPVSTLKLAAFVMIWSALVVFMRESFARPKSASGQLKTS